MQSIYNLVSSGIHSLKLKFSEKGLELGVS